MNSAYISDCINPVIQAFRLDGPRLSGAGHLDALERPAMQWWGRFCEGVCSSDIMSVRA